MVLKDGKPILAISTPGGDNQDQALLQVLLNIIDFGMSPAAGRGSAALPDRAFLCSSFANHEFVAGKLNLEDRIPKDTIDALSQLGHKVTVQGPWSNGSAPVVIEIGDGVLQGGADPRRSRYIFGR